MKYVVLLGNQSQDFKDLDCLATNLISTFWYAYYGAYQGQMPPEVAKQHEGRKGLHYNLEPLKLPAEIIPIYEDNQMILIVQLYSKPKNVVKDLFNLLSLTKNKDFWNMIIKHDNIVNVSSETRDGFTRRTHELGLDKKLYDKVVNDIINKQQVENIDMYFVHTEQAIPFTMLNVNSYPDYSKNEWIKALEKGINPNFLRVSLGVDISNDPLTEESLDKYCRNIRQAIMLMCSCKTPNEVVEKSVAINNVEKTSYAKKHGK